MKNFLFIGICIFSLFACNSTPKPESQNQISIDTVETKTEELAFDSTTTFIHILVALCDNTYQGIVPVPVAIGNGQDPRNNLYWGCQFGIKTFFKNSPDWNIVSVTKIDTLIYERVVFKHTNKDVFIVADAYNGKYIKQCTRDFLLSLNGSKKGAINVGERSIGTGGNANLVAYIGHDGLMDFDLYEPFDNIDGRKRDAIILACFSKYYFQQHLDADFVNPLIWTSHLMAPEAYSIHDAISGYILGETNAQIRERAVNAYAKYQKCSIKAARNLLVTGW